MSFFIACRLSSYGQFQEEAWTHLPSLGIRHIEMHVPDDLEVMRARLARSRLSASSAQARCDVTSKDVLHQLRPQLAAISALGTPLCLIALQPVAVPRDVVLDRLRRVGDAAAEAGVTIAQETHPDLLTNADVATETMARINHPRVRINFDTGNVYFYNQGRDAVSELEKLLPWVASLHLKDSDGGYQHRPFPAMGEGVVDFRQVFALLRRHHFSGPCTIELDMKERQLDESGQLIEVEKCVAYLRRIGALT